MSIFGSFDELPFPDVVSALERRTGHLRIWNIPGGKSYTFHLNKGVLQALQIDQARLTDIFELREAVVSIMQAGHGEFEFKRCSPAELATGLNKSIQHLLLSASTAIDEMNAYRKHFADTRTRFRVVNSLDTWTDQDLQQFWQQGQGALMQGASAEELAPYLGIGLENVQLCLYKLRALGVVAPVQEFRQRAEQRRRAVQHSTQPLSQPQQHVPSQSTERQPLRAAANVKPQTQAHLPADEATDLTDEFADLIAWADELDQKSNASTTYTESVISPKRVSPAQHSSQQPQHRQPRPQADAQLAAQSQRSDRRETMIQRMIRALSFGKRS